MRLLELDPMEDIEAAAFKYEFKQRLAALPFRDAADQSDQSQPAKESLRKSPSALEPVPEWG